MTRRMLINATHDEECRIAIADDDQLLELEIESSNQQQLKGNIYKARITNVEKSLQAAFLDIGSKRNGFLQINDIHPAYFNNWPPENHEGRLPKPAIQDVLREGQNLIVQVVKDEREAKGATLTTNLSIPGRFLVLMIGSQRGGVSRKISDAGQRSRLRQAVQSLKVPPGMSVIVRTAGINKAGHELQADLDNLLKLWNQVVTQSLGVPKTPLPLFEESTLAIRTVRDFLSSDIDEILIDEENIFNNVNEFIKKTVPTFKDRIQLYSDTRPLFSNYMLDTQIEAIDSPEVTLPNGGSIVIDTTEAIVAIDVNSGRATSQADVEETAFETNKEAAKTIATQLRLRDLGGLIVIDFIDMLDKRHRLIVEKTLKDALRRDKAKVEISRISKFGLLEMSRQRLKSSIASQRYATCPTCVGRGRIKTSKSSALEALRKIESTAYAGGVDSIMIRLAPSPALFLLNEKRNDLFELEKATNVRIAVYADGRLHQHEYELEVNTEGSSSSSSSSQSSGQRGRGRDRGRGGGGRKRTGRRSSSKNSQGSSSSEGKKRSSRNNNRRRNKSRNSNQKDVSGGESTSPKSKEVELKKEAPKKAAETPSSAPT